MSHSSGRGAVVLALYIQQAALGVAVPGCQFHQARFHFLAVSVRDVCACCDVPEFYTGVVWEIKLSLFPAGGCLSHGT